MSESPKSSGRGFLSELAQAVRDGIADGKRLDSEATEQGSTEGFFSSVARGWREGCSQGKQDEIVRDKPELNQKEIPREKLSAQRSTVSLRRIVFLVIWVLSFFTWVIGLVVLNYPSIDEYGSVYQSARTVCSYAFLVFWCCFVLSSWSVGGACTAEGAQ